VVTIAEQVDNRRKHLTILKNLYSGDKTLIDMAGRAQQQFDVGEGDQFWAFQVDVGNLFIELKEELDKGLEDLGDFSDADPALWDEDDWVQFYVAVAGHKFEDIYLKMAKRQPNIDLIWGEIENRLDLP
jgi:hypothetical protein